MKVMISNPFGAVTRYNSRSHPAQLVSDLGWMMGRQPDGFNEQREIIAQTMKQVASLIGSFSNFDTQWILPIDYSVVAAAP
jgi:hypothetical protein